MVRTVNEAARSARRNAILDAAERAIETKGYEQMAIADAEKPWSFFIRPHLRACKPRILAFLKP